MVDFGDDGPDNATIAHLEGLRAGVCSPSDAVMSPVSRKLSKGSVGSGSDGDSEWQLAGRPEPGTGHVVAAMAAAGRRKSVELSSKDSPRVVAVLDASMCPAELGSSSTLSVDSVEPPRGSPTSAVELAARSVGIPPLRATPTSMVEVTSVQRAKWGGGCLTPKSSKLASSAGTVARPIPARKSYDSSTMFDDVPLTSSPVDTIMSPVTRILDEGFIKPGVTKKSSPTAAELAAAAAS